MFLKTRGIAGIKPDRIVDGADCGIIVIDPCMEIRGLNGAARTLAEGTGGSEPDSVKCHSRLFGLDGPCPGCPAAEAFATGRPVRAEISFRERSFHVKAVPEPETGLLICYNRETTETAALLKQLARSEKQYSRVISGIPMGIMMGRIVADRKGKPVDYVVTHVNPAFEDHTGIPGSALLNRRISRVFPGVADLGIEMFSDVAITGEPIERISFSTVIQRHIKLFVFCLEPGKFACILNDLTREKAVEDRLRLVESAVEASSDEIYFLDENGYFIYGNRTVENNLGMGQQDLKKTHISGFNPSATPEWWNDYLGHLRARGRFQIESSHRRADGTVYPVELSSTLVSSGRSQFVCTIARDTTAQTEELTTLSRNRDSLETGLETVSMALWTYFPGTGRFGSDRRWAVFTGQGNTPLNGTADEHLFPVIHRDYRKRFRLELSSSPFDSGVFTCRLSAPGETRWMRMRWRRTGTGTGAKITAVAEDITSERSMGLLAAGSASSCMDTVEDFAGQVLVRVRHVLDAIERGDGAGGHRLLSHIRSDMEDMVSASEPSRTTVYLQGFLTGLAPTIDGLLGGTGLFTSTVPSTATVQCDTGLLERFFVRLSGFVGHALGEGTGIHAWATGGGGCDRIIIDVASSGEALRIPSGHPALIQAYRAIRAMGGEVSGEPTSEGIRLTLALPSKVPDRAERVVLATDDAIEARTVATVLRHMSLTITVCGSGSEAIQAMEPGDALIISTGLRDFPRDLPEKTLVLGSGYSGSAANLPRAWTITALRAAISRVLGVS